MKPRHTLAGLLLALLLAACGSIGDGKIAGREPVTATGQAITSATARARALIESRPEILAGARLALRAYCAAGCPSVGYVAERVSTLAARIRAGGDATDAEQQIADALGDLDAAVREAVISEAQTDE